MKVLVNGEWLCAQCHFQTVIDDCARSGQEYARPLKRVSITTVTSASRSLFYFTADYTDQHGHTEEIYFNTPLSLTTHWALVSAVLTEVAKVSDRMCGYGDESDGDYADQRIAGDIKPRLMN